MIKHTLSQVQDVDVKHNSQTLAPFSIFEELPELCICNIISYLTMDTWFAVHVLNKRLHQIARDSWCTAVISAKQLKDGALYSLNTHPRLTSLCFFGCTRLFGLRTLPFL